MGLYASILTFFITLFMGIPVGICLGITGVVGVLFMGQPMIVVAQRMFTGLDSFPLMAIPFFILAGEIMNRGQITDRLIRFADLIVGRIRGALAHANIIASMFFGGITGSAAADTSSIGAMLIPAMIKQGYDPAFTAAVTASSSLQGPIIPPSILAVIYGATMGESIGALFAAGIPIGILFGVSDMIVVVSQAKRRNFPKTILNLTWREKLDVIGQALLALIMPVIILGGMFTGVFTPTEAAAVSVGYAFFISLFVIRTITLKEMPKVLYNAALTTASIFLLLATARLFGMVLTNYQVPQLVEKAIIGVAGNNKVAVILIINVILLIVGCFMDPGAAIIMLAPTLVPLARAVGMHSIQFGMLMITNLTLGLITPPVGLCLFIASDLAGLPMEKVARALVPFLLIHVLVVLAVAFFPDFSLFVPRLLKYA